MLNGNIEKFVLFLAEDKEAQAKARSFGGDVDALAAYAMESGFEVSASKLREFREDSMRLLEPKLKKAEQARASGTPGTQAFYALLELAETDSETASRLEELSTGTRADLIAYGREKGFIFDEQDLDAVGNDILEPSEELSEEELELVAGGTTAAAVAFVFIGMAIVLGVFIGGYLALGAVMK